MFLTMLIISMVISPYQLQRPPLTKAMGLVESGLNPFAIGDRGKSKGAYQVQERYWGRVPRDFYRQTIQTERILTQLVKQNKNNYYKAIQRYNGYSFKTVCYANKVRQKAIEVHLLEVSYI